MTRIRNGVTTRAALGYDALEAGKKVANQFNNYTIFMLAILRFPYSKSNSISVQTLICAVRHFIHNISHNRPFQQGTLANLGFA